MKQDKELTDIFKGIAKKEEKYFNELYKRFHKLVYAISFSILKNNENVEDVVQIIFTKIWSMDIKKLPTENEISWLYTLTKNETLNYLRKQKNTVNIEDIYYITEETNELNNIIDKDTYNRLISKLDRKEQEIISLKILSDLSFKEIAKILNMPIGTVQWKYYKSIHTMKMLLSNFTMFIISLSLLIKSKIARKSEFINSKNKVENIIIIEETENDLEIYDSEEKYKKDLANEIEKKELDEFKEDNSEKKIKEELGIDEEYMNEEVIVQPYKEFTLNEIGILSMAGLFFIITIIFLKEFIKHQQNAKKYVSK